MSTEIILKNLGSLLPGRINYSETVNAFLSEAYVSLANNVYFSTIRFGENLIIKEDVGQGHTHAFLNGIRIFSIKEKVLLVDKGFNSQIYSKEIAQREIKSLLLDLIKDAAQNAGYTLTMNNLRPCQNLSDLF
jgi:hypothetical protein